MSHPADDGNLPLHVGRDGGVHDAGGFIQLRLGSQRLQLPGQQPGQFRLTGSGRNAAGIRIRLGTHGNIL